MPIPSVNNTSGIVRGAMAPAPGVWSFQESIVSWATLGLSAAIAVPLLLQMRGASAAAMIQRAE